MLIILYIIYIFNFLYFNDLAGSIIDAILMLLKWFID